MIAAHVDDEVLGVGGTILQHVSKGDAVHILIMADGSGDVRGYKQDEKPRYHHFDGLELPVTAAGKRFKTGYEREYESMAASPAWKNAHKAADLLGAVSLQIHDLPDSRFDSADILDIAHLVEAAIDRVRPEIVYTHFGGDLSVDHRMTSEAVVTACRPKPGHPVKELYFFETPSNTEWALPLTFHPQKYVEIDPKEKNRILQEAYGSEMREIPHPRSIGGVEALASIRGSQSGYFWAEAFMVGRIIE